MIVEVRIEAVCDVNGQVKRENFRDEKIMIDRVESLSNI